ncbi:hypothetical protein SNOG_04368 [Parastagonospora nodorum SN15]|uniref:D-isomer specific 2-hydroxyacid dehydrogenase NAD-binding domain-containing protein n=1 Tax=Phaeosphaeria nodorum (strain SN15 / ATCC MYA-4574 / FGSC 10173) TaxID=321614 RepID=Q0UV46_PHANO|nr:hypothetical protein SNOG_04368 [Parastagonospora nodorum SN15]EAT88128.2 hypothetical protein SNOG_04368 [Parastagonospora nodorum SN15]
MGGGPEAPSKQMSGKKELVLCALPFPLEAAKKAIALLEEEFNDVDIEYYYTPQQKPTTIPDADAKALPNVNLIQFFSAGTNHIAQHPIYTDSKIPLCSANGVHGPQIAEWVIMMDLVHSHKFPKLYDLQKEKTWKQAVGMGISDRVGKRVGILGYGSIGRQVARVAKAMGMDVIAYTASPRKTPESKKDGGYIVPGTGDPDGSFPSAWYSGTNKEDVHEFLKQEIDLLVIAASLPAGKWFITNHKNSKATTHFLSTEEFELLHKSNSRGTYVANIARGQVIDQPALVKALEDGLISGAAVDVTDPEPLPVDDPLWTAPNVLITPHVSGSTDVYADRAFEVLRENIRRERSGKKLVNEVDRERGY